MIISKSGQDWLGVIRTRNFVQLCRTFAQLMPWQQDVYLIRLSPLVFYGRRNDHFASHAHVKMDLAAAATDEVQDHFSSARPKTKGSGIYGAR